MVHFITVSDELQWPDSVTSLANLLTQPLPGWFANGPFPPISRYARHLVPVLQTSKFSGNPEDQRLASVFNTVLDTCETLRRCKHANNLKPNSQATWYDLNNFLSALGLIIDDEAYILNDVRCYQPVAPDQLPEERVTFSRANLMISYFYKCPALANTLLTGEMQKNELHFSGYQYDGISATSQDTSVSFDYPLEAHVVAGTGRRTGIFLPVVCIADAENINTVIAGVLYQRYICGIREPVIGLTVGKYDTRCQVTLAWLSGQHTTSHSLGHLPPICTAWSMISEMGCFELADPSQIFSLAQFLLGLDTHFVDIANSFRDPEERHLGFHWRADLVVEPRLQNIEEWRDEVNRCCTRSSSPASSLLPQSQGSELNSHTMSQQPQQKRERDPSLQRESPIGPRAKKPKVFTLPHVPSNDSKTKDSASKEVKNPQSGVKTGKLSVPNSNFVSKAGDAKGLEVDFTASHFLLERSACRYPYFKRTEDRPHQTDADEIEKFHAKSLFSEPLLVPEGWLGLEPKSLNELPPVDPYVEPLRDLFFHQLKEYYSSNPERVLEVKLDGASPESKAVKHVVDQFSFLMSFVRTVVGRDRIALKRGEEEQERQLQWNVLLAHFGQTLPSFVQEQPCLTDISSIPGITDTLSVSGTRPLHSIAAPGLEMSSTSSQLTGVWTDVGPTKAIFEGTLKHSRNTTTDNLTNNSLNFKPEDAISATQNLILSNRGAVAEMQASAIEVIRTSGNPQDTASQQLLKKIRAYQTRADADADALEKGDLFSADGYIGRGQREPHTARFDAGLVIALDGFAGEPRQNNQKSQLPPEMQGTESLMNHFAAIVHPSTVQNPSTPSPRDSADMNLMTCFQTDHSNNPALEQPDPNREVTPLSTEDPQFAILLANWKTSNQSDLIHAGHQIRTAIVSHLMWMHTLGITDVILYGLLAGGAIGDAYFAWYSDAHKRIFIVDNNVASFNISSPIQIYEAAIFLSRLQHEAAPNLLEKLKAYKSQWLDDFQTNEGRAKYEKWYKKVQSDELQLRVPGPSCIPGPVGPVPVRNGIV